MADLYAWELPVLRKYTPPNTPPPCPHAQIDWYAIGQGCGKTTVARRLLTECGFALLPLSFDGIISTASKYASSCPGFVCDLSIEGHACLSYRALRLLSDGIIGDGRDALISACWIVILCDEPPDYTRIAKHRIKWFAQSLDGSSVEVCTPSSSPALESANTKSVEKKLANLKRKHRFIVESSDSEDSDNDIELLSNSPTPASSDCVGDMYMTLDGCAMKLAENDYVWWITRKDLDLQTALLAVGANINYFVSNHEHINLDTRDHRVTKMTESEIREVARLSSKTHYHCSRTNSLKRISDFTVKNGSVSGKLIVSFLQDDLGACVNLGSGNRWTSLHALLWVKTQIPESTALATASFESKAPRADSYLKRARIIYELFKVARQDTRLYVLQFSVLDAADKLYGLARQKKTSSYIFD